MVFLITQYIFPDYTILLCHERIRRGIKLECHVAPHVSLNNSGTVSKGVLGDGSAIHGLHFIFNLLAFPNRILGNQPLTPRRDCWTITCRIAF